MKLREEGNALPGMDLMLALEVPLKGDVMGKCARGRVVRRGQLKGGNKGRGDSCVTQSLTEIFSEWKADELFFFWRNLVTFESFDAIFDRFVNTVYTC